MEYKSSLWWLRSSARTERSGVSVFDADFCWPRSERLEGANEDARKKVQVDSPGFEPGASSLRRKRSAADLRARIAVELSGLLICSLCFTADETGFLCQWRALGLGILQSPGARFGTPTPTAAAAALVVGVTAGV